MLSVFKFLDRFKFLTLIVAVIVFISHHLLFLEKGMRQTEVLKGVASNIIFVVLMVLAVFMVISIQRLSCLYSKSLFNYTCKVFMLPFASLVPLFILRDLILVFQSSEFEPVPTALTPIAIAILFSIKFLYFKYSDLEIDVIQNKKQM